MTVMQLIKDGTAANGLLTRKQVYSFMRGDSPETKLRASGPNSSSAWQRTVLICTSTDGGEELVAQVVLTNVNWQAAPQVVLDPSCLWYAFAPGNGTHQIGAQSVTISGDTEISATGATNGQAGINVSVEKN